MPSTRAATMTLSVQRMHYPGAHSMGERPSYLGVGLRLGGGDFPGAAFTTLPLEAGLLTVALGLPFNSSFCRIAALRPGLSPRLESLGTKGSGAISSWLCQDCSVRSDLALSQAPTQLSHRPFRALHSRRSRNCRITASLRGDDLKEARPER